MEAIAAAGALPGLASATIQLGTATFHFYQQLHSLYKAIKHGENDLSAAVRKLDQHGDFIKELRFNFERTSDAGVSASTRDLFQRSIADSEAEVEDCKRLLDRVGKHRFKRKARQAVETGSRLRFHEQNIQKYCDLLDKQMQRFLFLQSSVQSIRVESTLSEVMETLIKQGAKAIAFYEEQSSLREDDTESNSRLHIGSKKTKISSRETDRGDHITSNSSQDVTPRNWIIGTAKRYHTLCGVVKVTTFFNSTISKDKDPQVAYKLWFEPYSWISRRLVEWRYQVSSARRGSTLTLSMTTSIVCNDPDILDALGLVAPPKSYPLPRVVIRALSLQKVRALLDTGWLLKDHVLCLEGLDPKDIITVYLESYSHTIRHMHPEHYDPSTADFQSGSSDLSQLYLEYYTVTQLLFSYGFKPHLSSWQYIYDLAIRDHYHNQSSIRRFNSALNLDSKSIPLMILEAYGHSIPVNFSATFDEQLDIPQSSLSLAGEVIMTYYTFSSPHASLSHLAHLITVKDSAQRIKEILELDPLDLADEQYMFDRWLLGLFAPFRSDIASLVQKYLKPYRTSTSYNYFDVAYIREEFKQPPCRTNRDQRRDFLDFVCFYGSKAIIQQLDIAALTMSDTLGMHHFAALSSNEELFDFLMTYRSTIVYLLPHTQLVRNKLTSNPEFQGKFIRFVETSGQEPLSAIISKATLETLLFPNSYPLPEHIQNLILGQVRRYETQRLVTRWEIHSLMYRGMKRHWECGLPAKHLLQDLHFYDILRLLAQSPVFKSSLDTTGSKPIGPILHILNKSVVYPHPSVEGYSALMLALHCGMKPAVQILADAGASILKPMSCGKSALSVARENVRAQHPRQWTVSRSPDSGTVVTGPYHILEDRRISKDTDMEMLDILLKALRDRGDVEREAPGDLPTLSRWNIFRSKAYHLTKWLFTPSRNFDADTLRENSIYAILVSTLGLLSIVKVLKAEFGDCLSHTVKFLSRPAVMIALVAWIIWLLR
ncbi:hypothetical protein GGR55DRAFT_689134 [Xylaria sp. FL0064]|nr:hypothetical protein GGR55DRAFT_689134 [Xylaria sp. FL0064]